MLFWLTPDCTASFICSPWSELCRRVKQSRNTPRPLIHTACVSQMLPGFNNTGRANTQTVRAGPHICHPWLLRDPGSESKDLRVTGHRWRFGVYSGHCGLCLCASEAMSRLNRFIFDTKIWARVTLNTAGHLGTEKLLNLISVIIPYLFEKNKLPRPLGF